ncbi:MAG: Asp/Glu/hydantoin racemase [Alphaproteobacteria bacterium]|nr:Asp/Glu/hydantoin racemase [Alphaproteobacteria bacterium]
MRILLLNPNTTEAVTERLAGAARAVAAPDTEIVPLTAPRGLPYIANRAEAVIGGAIALEVLAEHHTTVDAAIIAAFGDPALGGARELFPIPVIGLTEAGLLAACLLGQRYSIITFSQALTPWYRECIEWHGLEQRCAAIRAIDAAFTTLADVQDENQAHLIDLANRSVAEDGADVVVFSGAPLAGLAAKVRDRINAPVVDCAAAAIRLAEALVGLQPAKPTAGSFRRPAAKSSTGLPPVLAKWIAHE